MIFIITGGNGSGKSTQYDLFKQKYINVYDIDNAPVIPRGGTFWRQKANEYYLDLALLNQNANHDTYIFGHSLYGELLALPNIDKVKGMALLFLDCYDTVRIERLINRGDKNIDQDILNWAAWQRMHLYDPQWRIDIIKEDCIPYMKWERWEHWKKNDPRWNCDLLDNTHMTIAETFKFIEEWVIKRKKEYESSSYNYVGEFFDVS